MRVSDYIFQYISNQAVGHVFMLPGGGAMHLVDALGQSGLDYVCLTHEQAVAIAAESYAQHTGRVSVALVTSGPGGTNALTGVTAGWIDSTPMLIISGQAKREDLIGTSGVRQMGSQEVNIIEMVKPVTKYAVQVLDASDIRYHLERAWHEASSGRKGPVWLDIPLDIQGAEIEPSALRSFCPAEPSDVDISEDIEAVLHLLAQSERPLFLAGNGIRLSGAEGAFIALAEKLNIPMLTTWKAIDLVGEDHPLYMGHPGVMGDRGANIILQNCDLLMVIGSRLDSSLTAYDQGNFAKSARKIVVDIDPAELGKLTMENLLCLAVDAGRYIRMLDSAIRACGGGAYRWHADWLPYCEGLRERYPVILPAHADCAPYVSAYHFIDRLCEQLNDNDVIVPESSGGAGEITYQAFRLKAGQKMKNAAGLGAMGFGLPYAIGACLANERRRTVLINGDGAFQLNIQELEAVRRLNLPIKIFIWANGGYASIRSMQNGLFDGRLVASDEKSGFTVPDICKVAEAYGFKTLTLCESSAADAVIREALHGPEPVVCVVNTPPDETVAPRTKTVKLEDGRLVSKPLDDMWPFLSHEELVSRTFSNRQTWITGAAYGIK